MEDTVFDIKIDQSCRCVQCEEDEICGGLWKGTRYPYIGSLRIGNTPNGTDGHPYFDVDSYLLRKKIHLVISHCAADLSWISNFIKGFEIASIHVVTKCGRPVTGAPSDATIEEMPNIGRCDHTYAHYITTIMDRKVKEGEENDSIVVFLKDDISGSNQHNGGSWSHLGAMIRTASSENGFACGCIPKFFRRRNTSTYADTKLLFKFEKFIYFNPDHKAKGYNISNFDFIGKNYTDLGAFYNMLPVETPPEITQVCYGGVFAASVPRIKERGLAVWKHLEGELSRGDNIQEGHYTERSWAILLSKPLQPFQIEALRKYSTGLLHGNKNGSLLH